MGKLRELGLVGIGAVATVRDKFKKLVKKGEENEGEFKRSQKKVVSTAKKASKEALAISKKSLMLLEKELKKLEAEAKKTEKHLGAKKKKRI